MLQPRNWTQARGRNLYNVAYRRSGTYKGLGQADPGTTIMDVNIVQTVTGADGLTYGVDAQGNLWSYATGQMVGPAQTAANTSIQTTFKSGGITYGIDAIGQVFNMLTGALAAPSATAAGAPKAAAQPNWTPYIILGGGILLVMLIARK